TTARPTSSGALDPSFRRPDTPPVAPIAHVCGCCQKLSRFDWRAGFLSRGTRASIGGPIRSAGAYPNVLSICSLSDRIVPASSQTTMPLGAIWAATRNTDPSESGDIALNWTGPRIISQTFDELRHIGVLQPSL